MNTLETIACIVGVIVLALFLGRDALKGAVIPPDEKEDTERALNPPADTPVQKGIELNDEFAYSQPEPELDYWERRLSSFSDN